MKYVNNPCAKAVVVKYSNSMKSIAVHVSESAIEAYDDYATCYAGSKRTTFTVHHYIAGIVFYTQRFGTFKEHSAGTYFGRLTYSPNITSICYNGSNNCLEYIKHGFCGQPPT